MLQQESLRDELKSFFHFFGRYISSRFLGWGRRFETIKDIVVAFLVVKRGKYSQSFLNVSFFMLLSTILIAGPIIVENNPFVSNVFSQAEQSEASILATDINSISLATTVSEHGRSGIVEHTVKPGETLDGIASQFDISVETIKWENNLTSDNIKNGQTLRIPPITGVVHKVRSGDSIYTIAKRYNVDAQVIANYPFNEFEDLESFNVTVGQVIYVPDGVIKQAATVRRAPQVPLKYAKVVAGAAGQGTFIWPTNGTVSQTPVYYHMALDIANRALPGVIASDGGTVTFSGCLSWGYGCHIIIDHGNGFSSLYAHLSEIYIDAGRTVSQGQSIGRLGSTGRSTGPHLHFEIRNGGALQNPLSYLR